LPLFLARLRRSMRRRRPIDRRQAKSFLVVRLDARGDLILTTPLFRDLKESFPDARITAVVRQGFSSILEGNPFVDEVLELRVADITTIGGGFRYLRDTLSFYRNSLRGRHFDYAIAPRWDADLSPANLLCLMADSGRTVGYADRVRFPADPLFGRLADLFDITVPGDGMKHEVLRNRDVAAALGCISSGRGPELFPGERQQARAAALLKEAPPDALPIAIGLGAQHPRRRWPLERFAETVHGLAQQQKVFAFLLCGPGETSYAAELARMLTTGSCIVAEPDLKTTASVLSRCAVFLGNDSGPAHLAAAAECPVVVVSCHAVDGDPNHVSSPERFAPYSDRCIVLRPQTSRPPCVDGCCAAAPHCILSVSAESALAAIRHFLEGVAVPFGSSFHCVRSPTNTGTSAVAGDFHVVSD